MSTNSPYLALVVHMEPLMTIDEVAAYMQVSRFTVYRLVKERLIPGTKIGRQWRFQKEDIDQWVRAQYRKDRHLGA